MRSSAFPCFSKSFKNEITDLSIWLCFVIGHHLGTYR